MKKVSTCNYVYAVEKGFIADPEESVRDTIFKQYERVLVESLITSFGLDFLVRDRVGGDVDTIHNVRQIGKNPDMVYKNKAMKGHTKTVGNIHPLSIIATRATKRSIVR